MDNRIRSILVAVAIAIPTSGCYVDHRHPYLGDPLAACCLTSVCITALGGPPELAVAGGMVAGQIVLSQHDDHWHGPGCGCESRWYDGTRVYWYHGRWEYYADGRWFILRDDRGPR